VSPKAGAPLRQLSGDELEIAWPQPALDLDDLERLDFRYRFLQPIDGPDARENARWAVATCRERSAWHLSVQMHKLVGIA
jgi:organic radical activating enzyme